MYTLLQKFPRATLVLMILLLAMGMWQFSMLAGFGVPGYFLGFTIALVFFLIYWVTYARVAGSAFRAVLPLAAIGLLAAPFHLLGSGGLVAAMLFYSMLPGAGMILALGAMTSSGYNAG